MSDAIGVHDDLTLLGERDARARLRDRALRLRVLAPYGAWAGRGRLRVLRVTPSDAFTEVVAGYESYERLGARA